MTDFWSIIYSGLAENWQYFLGFSAILFGAFYARETAKKKNATDLLLHVGADSHLTENLKIIHRLHGEALDLRAFAKVDKNSGDEAYAIRYVLNHWEHVAVGINNKIYHEKIIKDASCNSLVHLYNKTKTYIEERNLLKGSETAYQELVGLAHKWINDPLKLKKPK